MRPRSANEWRSFWHHGGEAQLRDVLCEAWPPLRSADESTCARPAERVAALLGSNAPLRALASELGRIRAELGVEPDADGDQAAAARISAWFQSQA
jgi:hypothetical protein